MKISRHHDRICPETNLKCTTGFCLVDGACSIQEVDKHCTCTVPDTKCPVHIELPTQQSSTSVEEEAEMFFETHKMTLKGIHGGDYLDKEDFLKFASLPSSSVTGEEEVVKVLDWVSSFETDESEEFLSDSIIICDGQYYWKSDNDGDQPLNGKDLYRIYKKLNPSLPVTGESEAGERKFTLKEALDVWNNGFTASQTKKGTKTGYFKDKFGIDI